MSCPFGCDPSTPIKGGEEMHWLMGWWPHLIDGIEHRHDPNRRMQLNECANGHKWEKRWFIPCPACGHVEGKDEVVMYRNVGGAK